MRDDPASHVHRAHVVLALAAVSTVMFLGASGAQALTVKRQLGNLIQRVVSGPHGFAIYDLNRRGRLVLGEIIDYRRSVVILIDGTEHRYQTLSLSSAVARAQAQQRAALHISMEGVKLAAHPRERAIETSLTRTIRGIRTRAWLLRDLRGDVARAWYAGGPRPPAAIARLLAPLAPAGGASLAGRVALLVQKRLRGRWVTQVRSRSVRRGTRSAALRIPHGFRRGRVLPSVHRHHGGHAASTPATVSWGSSYYPVEGHQTVFAVYWGARFAHEPGTTGALNHALSQVIERGPYIDPLGQYGVHQGSFIGSSVQASNPPRAIGDTSALGFAVGLPMVSWAQSNGALGSWSRTGPDPLVVLFVPKESVVSGSGNGNNGYHSVVPVNTALLDPLGLIQLQIYPYAVVKVPPLTDPKAIDEATTTLSHETVEAATDPVPTSGWTDPSKSSLHPAQQGEIADICHEGTHSPWGDTTRLNGVAVATYWSQSAGSCLPESRPSVRIVSPSGGATVPMGRGVGLAGSASDPLDGPLSGSSLDWTEPAVGDLGHGSHVIAHLQPGVHHITLTATDSQGLTATAHLTITVVASPPTVRITDPAGGSSFGSDQTVLYQGSAHDPQDGTLSGSWLHWELLQSGLVVADLGTGSEVQYDITSQGDYTMRLTATDAEGLSSSSSIAVHIGPPSGNPSVTIDDPADGTSFYNSCSSPTDTVYFSGQATDPHDGSLYGSHLVWYDDYNGNHVEMGTGDTLDFPLAEPCGLVTYHTITLTATDSLGHSASYVIHITTGAPG